MAPLWLARGIFRYFEKTAIDYGMNAGVQKAVGWSARVVQGTQTGVSQVISIRIWSRITLS